MYYPCNAMTLLQYLPTCRQISRHWLGSLPHPARLPQPQSHLLGLQRSGDGGNDGLVVLLLHSRLSARLGQPSQLKMLFVNRSLNS